MRYIPRLLAVALLTAAPATTALAQSFTKIETNISPSVFGAASLGDVDGDGLLDVILTGLRPTDERTRVIYLNRGAGASPGTWSFETVLPVDAGTQISENHMGTTDLGDYDNDGDLDLLVVGFPGSSVVFQNDGGATFSRVDVDLPFVAKDGVLDVISGPNANWIDYDNDGDLDLLFVGNLDGFDGQQVTSLFRNDGQQHFTEVDLGLPDALTGPLDWGDYDNDGDLDLLAALSIRTDSAVTRIFQNEGGETFSTVDAGLPDIMSSGMKWGDYDNDGDLDVIFTGSVVEKDTGEPNSVYFTARPRTSIFRNDNGLFVEDQEVSLPPSFYGDWIDVDNDGDLDLLLDGSEEVSQGAGSPYYRTFLRIVRNDGGAFETVVADLDGVWNGAIATGDLDGDGDVDVFAAGLTWQSPDGPQSVAFIYRNDTQQHNTPPTAPTALRAGMAGNQLTLAWDPGADVQTPEPALTYNLRVGTRPGAADVVSPMATADGVRLVSRRGNVDHNLRWEVRGLDPNEAYYWSVQAIDNGAMASPFAPEQVFDGQMATATGPTADLPGDYALLGNYPNPFNPETTIRYTIPEATHVRLSVFDVLGAEIAVLFDGTQQPGRHRARWDGRDTSGRPAASGVYIYRLQSPRTTLAGTMLLIK